MKRHHHQPSTHHGCWMNQALMGERRASGLFHGQAHVPDRTDVVADKIIIPVVIRFCGPRRWPLRSSPSASLRCADEKHGPTASLLMGQKHNVPGTDVPMQHVSPSRVPLMADCLAHSTGNTGHHHVFVHLDAVIARSLLRGREVTAQENDFLCVEELPG